MQKLILFLSTLVFLHFGSLFAQPQLSYEIREVKAEDGMWQFDLYASSTEAGTFHSRGQVYIRFNPEAVTGQEESGITLTPLTLLEGQDPSGQSGKYMAKARLNSSDRLVVTWFASFLGIPASPEFHNEVPQTPTPLFRITLPKADGDQAPAFTLDEEMSKGQSFYLKTGEVKEMPYGGGW